MGSGCETAAPQRQERHSMTYLTPAPARSREETQQDLALAAKLAKSKAYRDLLALATTELAKASGRKRADHKAEHGACADDTLHSAIIAMISDCRPHDQS